MSSHGVMSTKEAGNTPLLYPVYGQLVLAVGLGPEISFRACLLSSLRPHHIAACWLSVQRVIQGTAEKSDDFKVTIK